MDEIELHISRARNGDMRAFDEVVRRFRGYVLRYAYSILRDWETAHDVAQESFIQAYVHLPNLREPAAFPVWMRTIVSRCCARVTRRKRLPTVKLDDLSDAPSDSPDPPELVSESEAIDRIHAAISDLPDAERAVTELFYIDGCSQKEIAEALGIPATTVNNRLYSARAMLRSMAARIMGDDERPSKKREKETAKMLTHTPAERKLLKGDSAISIRTMTEDDIPAMRRLDDEIAAGLDLANACRAPGSESVAGGPWADDQELREHFKRLQSAGNITLLAEDSTGKLVGFADLWTAREPQPFGDSLNVECIDFLWEYFHVGIETIMLEEAEKVARSAGLPALDIGTNTSSGSYPSLRRFGMSVFYEYDHAWCDCDSLKTAERPEYRELTHDYFDRTGLLRISHWSPTDFDFEHDPGRPGVHEFEVDGERVVADFWRLYAQSPEKPIGCELFAPPKALASPEMMSKILRATAVLASDAGADRIPLPCPSDIEIDTSLVPVIEREFAFAWMRKQFK